MPAGLLSTIAGLGGAASGYSQGQDNALKRALLQQEQQKQQRALQAERIAALFRQGNAPLANVTGGMGSPGLPPNPMAGTPASSPPPPLLDPSQTGGASSGAPPSGPPIPLDSPISRPLPNQAPQATGGLGGFMQRSAAAAPGPQPEPTSLSPSMREVPSSDAGGGTGELMMTPPGGQPIPVTQLLGQRQSFSTILDTIASQAPPGTDPAIIYEAAGMVHKNVMQDNRDPMSLAILKMAFPTANFTLAEQGRQNRFDVSSGQAQQRINQGQTRLDQGQQRINQGAQRLNNQQYQQAYQRGTTQQKAQLGELHRQLGEIDRQVNQAIAQGQAVPSALSQRRDALAAKETALAKQLGYAPEPEK